MPTSRFTGPDIRELETHFARRATANTFYGRTDLSYGPMALVIGADALGSTRTDATTKQARFGAAHYTTTEEPATLMIATSTSTATTLLIGGGSGIMNAATQILFYTAANTTTTTGTRRMTIDSTGNIGIGQPAPTARLHLPAGVASAGGAPLKLAAGTNLAVPESGCFEFDGTSLFFTVGGVRKTVTLV